MSSNFSSSNTDFDNIFAPRNWFQSGAQLWSWGSATAGKLGNNTTTPNQSSPVQIGALIDWKYVDTKYFHNVAVKSNGTLWTWGTGTNGRLGLNSAANVSSPTQVGALTTWRTPVAGSAHSMAITTAGALWSWGSNANGRLGQNATVTLSSPVQVGALTTWISIATGLDHSLAVQSNGTLWTWGLGSSGELGQNATVTLSSPTQVGALTNWIFVAGGEDTSAAITRNGQLWMWGSGQYSLLAQPSDVTDKSSPVQVGTLTNWKQVSLRYRQAMATKWDGTLWGWGDNGDGQLGLNTSASTSSPVQVGTLTTWYEISSGFDNQSPRSSWALAVKTDGSLWAWGQPDVGRMGLNSTVVYSSPVQVGNSFNWKQAKTGEDHAAALLFVDL